MQMNERRNEDRWDHLTGTVVSVDGYPARIHDLSPQGARLEFRQAVSEGDTLRLDLPWAPPVRATVLERMAGVIRLRLESAVECW